MESVKLLCEMSERVRVLEIQLQNVTNVLNNQGKVLEGLKKMENKQ